MTADENQDDATALGGIAASAAIEKARTLVATGEIPMAQVISKAEEHALSKGNEVHGFLSYSNGFLPMLYPEQQLPPKWAAWDDLGKTITQKMSDLTLRSYCETELEVLTVDDLDDKYLYRAALLVGIAGHGYWYCGPAPPASVDDIPPSIKQPWDAICQRLQRKGTFLSGEEIQLYNFTYLQQDIAPSTPFSSQTASFCIEGLRMLQSLWGNHAEAIFHLAFCEMAKAAAPQLAYMAVAQDAVLRKDDDTLLKAIISITDSTEQISNAFMKIHPDETADLSVDPLVWAKTVAPVGATFHKGMPSPSGLSTPFFHSLDIFLGRPGYESTLGKDTVHARQFMPQNWLDVIAAIGKVSVHAYVAESDNPELRATWAHCVEVYASWNGFLGKHCQKTYGFLELAFKCGREVTLGGFVGGFRDRMWDTVMDLLDDSREERYSQQNVGMRLLVAKPVKVLGAAAANTKLIEYQLPGGVPTWQPGDTVSTYPQNEPTAIDTMLQALGGASGEESIMLSGQWKAYMMRCLEPQQKHPVPDEVSLQTLLARAQLYPVTKSMCHSLARLFPTSSAIKAALQNLASVGIADLLVQIGSEHQAKLSLGPDGIIFGAPFVNCETLYAQLDTSLTNAGPLTAEMHSLLLISGVQREDLPKCSGVRISYEEFESVVYPLITGKSSQSGTASSENGSSKPKRTNSRNRRMSYMRDSFTKASSALDHLNIIDLLIPLVPRQYSIANLDTRNKTMTLLVSRLNYMQKKAVCPTTTVTPASRGSRRNLRMTISRRNLRMTIKQSEAAAAAEVAAQWHSRRNLRMTIEQSEAAEGAAQWYSAPQEQKEMLAEESNSDSLGIDMASLQVSDNLEEEVEIHGVASNYICDGRDVHFTLCSNAAFHPPPTTAPIVMIGAGSGVSPFRGFWQQRCAAAAESPSDADTVLLWSIPHVADGDYLFPELAGVMKTLGPSTDIRVTVSRESSWPKFLHNGTFEMKTKRKMRLDAVMKRDVALRSKLQSLLLPTQYGGKGGYAYFCGSATFVRSLMNELGDILMDLSLLQPTPEAEARLQVDACGKPLSWLTSKLVADGKIVYEVFNDKTAQNPPKFGYSDLAVRNDPDQVTQGLWMAIYGQIYNVASFVHPGGPTILEEYCGIDATVPWEAVRHHRSQSLNAKLFTLHVGSLHVPQFNPIPVLQLGDGNLTDIDGVLESWRVLLQDIVQIENAARIEFGIVERHVAGGFAWGEFPRPPPEELTPMKLQMAFQAHKKVIFTHITATVGIGLLKARQHSRSLRNVVSDSPGEKPSDATEISFDVMLEKLAQNHRTAETLLAVETLIECCHTADDGKDRESTLAVLRVLARVVKTLDLTLVRKWKLAVRDVFLYFESIDGETVDLIKLHYVLQNAALAMIRALDQYVVAFAEVSEPLWALAPAKFATLDDSGPTGDEVRGAGEKWLFVQLHGEFASKDVKTGHHGAAPTE